MPVESIGSKMVCRTTACPARSMFDRPAARAWPRPPSCNIRGLLSPIPLYAAKNSSQDEIDHSWRTGFVRLRCQLLINLTIPSRHPSPLHKGARRKQPAPLQRCLCCRPSERVLPTESVLASSSQRLPRQGHAATDHQRNERYEPHKADNRGAPGQVAKMNKTHTSARTSHLEHVSEDETKDRRIIGCFWQPKLSPSEAPNGRRNRRQQTSRRRLIKNSA